LSPEELDSPYISAEGGYQFTHGGPYDAREELEGKFPDAAPEDLERAVELLDETCTEWSGLPSEDEDIEPGDEPGDEEDLG